MAKDQPKLAMKRPKVAPRASMTMAAPATDAKLQAELSSLAVSMRGPVFSLRIWDDVQHVRKELVLKAMEVERRDDRAKRRGSRATARTTVIASVETADAAPQEATKRLSTNVISPEELKMQRDLCCYYLGAIVAECSRAHS